MTTVNGEESLCLVSYWKTCACSLYLYKSKYVNGGQSWCFFIDLQTQQIHGPNDASEAFPNHFAQTETCPMLSDHVSKGEYRGIGLEMGLIMIPRWKVRTFSGQQNCSLRSSNLRMQVYHSAALALQCTHFQYLV